MTYMRVLRLAVLSFLFFGVAGCSSDGGGGKSAGQPMPVAWTVEADSVGDAIMITPSTALNGSSTYALVATNGIVDTGGRSYRASKDLARAMGVFLGVIADAPPEMFYSDDLESPDNPYPDARLVRDDGIGVPDRYVLRGVPVTEQTATARSILRTGANRLETLDGYSTTGPIRVALSAPVDISSVTPDTLMLFERRDGAADLPGLLRITDQMGVARDDIAIAFSFPTQSIEDDLVAVRRLLRKRIADIADPVELDDPDPADDLPIGIFAPGDPEFADFFATAADVSRVVAGLVSSPNFRGEDGIWVADRISGAVQAPEEELDFLLTIPSSGTPPYPVVMVQHGFGGSNQIVLDLAQELAERGLAAIGINAVVHGRRGNPLELLQARPFVARDIFRQSVADQMAVLRAIEAGIDIDNDGEPDLDSSRMSYIGISLGGILGATLVAVEETLQTAVLNVAGGRIAFLGEAEGLRDLVQGELAAEVGLDIEAPEFQVYLQRVLETGQHAMDSFDGLNYARRWFLEPFPGVAPHRVLLQEGIGDTLVDNENTEALAKAGGLVANAPVTDPAGVSGLWRFDPPGGHGILARQDVRDQAFRFLASNGTEIIDPS